MIVYCYRNKTNNKKYIGITSRKIEERHRSHIYESLNKNSKVYNTPFKRAIRKYGIDNFELNILHTNVSEEEASYLEKKYIKKYKTYWKYHNSNGYNATIGGEKIMSTPRDRVVQVDINTYSVVNIYESCSDAERKYGRGIRESCEKIINKPFGFIWYFEKDFIKLSQEQLEDDICLRLKKIVQLDLYGNLIKTWNSSTEASMVLKISQGGISCCCTGRRKSCGGFMWMYYKDYKENKGNIKYKTNQDRSKKVAQYDIYGNLIKIHKSLTNASQSTGIQMSDISSVCNKKRNTAGGYVWKFLSQH